MASEKAMDGEQQAAADVNLDGIKVLDMTYYNLLGVRADATDAQLRAAYKKAALKNHPDRNRDDPEAEQKFQAIGEAYQVLSDSNLRAVYDRRGVKSAEARPEDGFEDPGQLFAKLFGGERFFDWIGEVSLGKDFAKAMDISMTEEEKAAMMQAEQQQQQQQQTPGAKTTTETPVTAGAAADSSAVPSSTTAPSESSIGTAAAGLAEGASAAAAPVTGPSTTTTTPPSTGIATASSTTSTDVHKPASSGTSTPVAGSSGTVGPGGQSQKPHKPSNKLTPEQRKQMEALAEERRKNEIERIHVLTNKLKDRIRPFVQSANPGDPSDPECKKWEERMREEIDDLKGESFGLELCRLIGQIYVTKAHSFLKAHKSPLSNLFGLSTWWGKMKDKSATVKEGWQFLSSTMDVQQAMSAMEKQQNGQDVAEEEMAKLEEAMMGKIMLVTWRGTRFEVASVLRQVVDGALAKEPGVSETQLVQRAKAILIIGSIMKNVQVDETDEERREMERLVAQAAQKKPKKGKK